VAEERPVDQLDDLRKRIDTLDEMLVRLLNSRAACALEIGRAKKQLGLAIYQPAREAEVLVHVQDINRGPLDDGAIKRLFERVIDEARRLERIAEEESQGNRGASAAGTGETGDSGGRHDNVMKE
jgi:chorismate mutase